MGVRKELLCAVLLFSKMVSASELPCTASATELYFPKSTSLGAAETCLAVAVSQYDSVSDEGLLFDQPDLPLHFTLQSEKDWGYLTEQTYTILGLSIVTVGLMTLLPESITKWDEDDRDLSELGPKWKENVSDGPVWDRDEHYLNYIMHPYFGGVYYTASRHAGFNEFESFGYSFAMSALFWEYGVESFAETPSWQDLFITPMFGAVTGELMLMGEQHILANDNEVWGSKALGGVSLFFLNPVGHIHYWVTDAWGGEAEGGLTFDQWFADPIATQYAFDSGVGYDPSFVGYQLKVTF